MQLSVSGEDCVKVLDDHLVNFGKGSQVEIYYFCEIILKSGHLPRLRCLNSRDQQPFCCMEQNNLINFSEGSYGEHFCEIITKSIHWLMRRCDLSKLLMTDDILCTRVTGCRAITTLT